MPRQLERDPFARATLLMDTRKNRLGADCRWCGTVPKFMKWFWWERDDRPGDHSEGHGFCSIACWTAYHGH